MATEVAEGLVNKRDAAEYLSVGVRTLERLVEHRELPCVRIGRAVRFDVNDLKAFVESRKD